ncbi:MAG: hypothetical protein AB7T63_03835 [Planctomycetota bacterium]
MAELSSMKILLVGSLSWNPERIASLAEQGHQLWGLWGRSMAWDQGPYPMLDGLVTTVTPQEAPDVIAREGLDVVYGLFQVYARNLWSPDASGLGHDFGVWDLLRGLLRARAAGRFDAPIVHHYGFDVHEIDLDVVRALDGHIVCNEGKWRYWTTPEADGGCGLLPWASTEELAFLDGDGPKAEFLTDDFAPRLSDQDGELHTVCVGRPLGLDVLALAQRGIHVHIYGNGHDDTYEALAPLLTEEDALRHRDLLARHVHLHVSLQAIGEDMAGVRRIKGRWVREFSRYDAGWSYVGNPFDWPPLDDLAAIPNKLGTYLMAGLPIISDRREGAWRYEEPRRLGVLLDLRDRDYDDLAADLREEVRTRALADRARDVRHEVTFDASLDALVSALEAAVGRYRAQPLAQRIAFEETDASPVRIPPRRRKTPLTRLRQQGARLLRHVRALAPGRAPARRLDVTRRAIKLREILGPWINEGAGSVPAADLPAAAPSAGTRRLAVLERFAEPSRRCEASWFGPDVALDVTEAAIDNPRARPSPLRVLASLPRWLVGPVPWGHRVALLRACLRTPFAARSALLWVPAVCRDVRAGRVHGVACYATKGLDVVPRLAQALDVPCHEVLAHGTKYLGEFAFEMQAVVPYAYHLHQQGRLERTISTRDTSCLYWFSPHHEERAEPRRYVPTTEYPTQPIGRETFDLRCFPRTLDTGRWVPPPYAERFADERFRFDKPTCVICNKTSVEDYLTDPGQRNAIPNDLLLELVALLTPHFQVVYNRPRAGDIVNDHQEVGEPGDLELLARRHPDVLRIQDLHARHPDLTFNELQLRVMAGCRHFVSVVGGSSYLASWFGGTNVVYARGGWEVDADAYRGWFHLFSGARVIPVDSPTALLEAARADLCPGGTIASGGSPGV